MTVEDRVNRIEDVIVLLKDLIVRHEDRLDTFSSDFKRSRDDFEFKMNALIDAQIKNETEIEKLREASNSQLNRIERLEGI